MDLQDILSPLRHLNVFTRNAVFKDKKSQYQIYVKSWRPNALNRATVKDVDIIGVGNTEEEAAKDVLSKTLNLIERDIGNLEVFREEINNKLNLFVNKE